MGWFPAPSVLPLLPFVYGFTVDADDEKEEEADDVSSLSLARGCL